MRLGTGGVALLAAWASCAAADPPTVHGHVKAQAEYLHAGSDSLAAAVGFADAQATALDVRVHGMGTTGGFGFEADYLLQAQSGRAVGLERALETLEPDLAVVRANVHWLPLDETITSTDHTRAVQSLDRFSMAYTSVRWVFKIGRQAYSWGNGIVFRPFDLFDPFAPDAEDMSYKPGIDAVYAQRLFADGSDVTVLAVPRRDATRGSGGHPERICRKFRLFYLESV